MKVGQWVTIEYSTLHDGPQVATGQVYSITPHAGMLTLSQGEKLIPIFIEEFISFNPIRTHNDI